MTILRRSFDVVCALSLMLLLATLFLWGRSYLVRDEFATQSRGNARTWSSDWGRINFGLFKISPDNGNDYGWTWYRSSAPGGQGPVAGPFWMHEVSGIGWDVRGRIQFQYPQSSLFDVGGVQHQMTAREWWVSYWVLALLFLPLATISLRRTVPRVVSLVRKATGRRRAEARGFPIEPSTQADPPPVPEPSKHRAPECDMGF